MVLLVLFYCVYFPLLHYLVIIYSDYHFLSISQQRKRYLDIFQEIFISQMITSSLHNLSSIWTNSSHRPMLDYSKMSFTSHVRLIQACAEFLNMLVRCCCRISWLPCRATLCAPLLLVAQWFHTQSPVAIPRLLTSRRSFDRWLCWPLIYRCGALTSNL